jgi:transglutaminase-like putative cysteine protease
VIYDISHRTIYDYSVPVPGARCVLRLTPANRPGQRLISHAVTAEPAGDLTEAADFFGNTVHRFALTEAHSRLVLTARATVEVTSLPASSGRGPTVAAARLAALAGRDLGPDAPGHGLFPSRHVPLVEAITGYTARSMTAERPLAVAVAELNRRIQADFVYDPQATDVGTSPATAFAAKRGVCQDFAHVMLAGLRGVGLAARYVSGYLRTVPPPGQKRLEGADATHAWIEVYAGEAEGWLGFDPTNGIAAGLDHIVVAVGRDYADVSPVDGVVRAAGGHDLSVSVDVVARSERAKAALPAG